MTSAKLYMFRGSEADSDIAMPFGNDRRPTGPTFFIDTAIPDPVSDDQRDYMVSDDATDADPFEVFGPSFKRQAKEQADLSWKWGVRCVYVIAAGVVVWFVARRLGWI